MTGLCTVDSCERAVHGRGLCTMHYPRWYRSGDDFDRTPERLIADRAIRLPAAPLLDAIAAELRRLDRGWAGWAKDHGIHPRYHYRWRDNGWVNIDHADAVCDALGRHPSEVYGDDYWSAAA